MQQNTPVPQRDRLEKIMQMYGNILFRLCLLTLGNASDAEDAVQETFLKYLQKAPGFENEEHEKAWLITVATNQCKDMLRFRQRHPVVEIEELEAFVQESSDCEILETLMMLPEKFKTVLLLYYVEEYSMEEIAKVIGKTKSAVKMRLQKGRKLLEEAYRKRLEE